jgi:hypothetical protein
MHGLIGHKIILCGISKQALNILVGHNLQPLYDNFDVDAGLQRRALPRFRSESASLRGLVLLIVNWATSPSIDHSCNNPCDA